MKTKLFIPDSLRLKYKNLLLASAFCLLPFALFSQAPQGFNYQAVARDGDNAILANTTLDVKIGLLQGSETGTLIWEETHSVTTNEMGLFTLKIGDTNATFSGGTVTTFSDINWTLGSYYIQVQVNDGGGYVDMGTAELLSVPYALFAEEGNEGPAGPQGLQGNQGLQGEQGLQGDQGSQGIQGIQGTQGIQGSQGPEGILGPTGPAGTGLNNQGSWSADSIYYEGDYVFDRSTGDPAINSMWIFQGTPPYTSSTQPYGDTDNWVEFEAPQGPPGDPATDDQTLSIDGHELTISGGNMVTLPDSIVDDDADPLNEIQDLQLAANNLTITKNASATTINLNPYLDDSNPWTIIGDDISYTGGKVSVGTPSGNIQFELSDAFSAGGRNLLIGDDSYLTDVDLTNTLGIYGNSDSTFASIKLGSEGPTLTGKGGNLGIGTLTPEGRLEVKGTGTENDTIPLFEVKRSDGQTVFAVYSQGVRVYVDDTGAKGPKGGFAVGGFSASKAGSEYLRVTPDSVRIYIDTATVKGPKGGFAVGGFSASKGIIGEYLRITNDSVRIYLNKDGAKGPKGGFAVGGYSSSKGIGNEYLRVTQDSVRVYIDTTNTKGPKGGFAVGGFSASKSSVTDFLRVTADSTRVSMKGSGGFQVSQLGAGTSDNFLDLTPDNYFIGHQAGVNTTPIPFSGQGRYNSFIGYQSGLTNSTGFSNIFLGYQSGYSNIDGFDNIFFGNEAGFANSTGIRNIFFGEGAGHENDDGYQNIFIGALSGYNNTSGNDNTFMGYQAGQGNQEGNDNVYIGYRSGYLSGINGIFKNIRNVFIGHSSGYNTSGVSGSVFIGYMAGLATTTANSNIFIGNEVGKVNETGAENTMVGSKSGWTSNGGNHNAYFGALTGFSDTWGAYNVYMGYASGRSIIGGYANVFLGSQAGYNKAAGTNNVLIGWQSGYNSGTGANNVFIGKQAGYSETGSNLLYIENSDAATPLIWGDFSADSISINGDFNVNGDAYSTSGTWTSSDIRFKRNITNYENALEQVIKMRGVRYDWKEEDFPEMNFSKRSQVGVIAQEVEKIIPELVITNRTGFKSVDYARFSAILIEAIKEQQITIEEQEERILQLENEKNNLSELKQIIEQIQLKVETLSQRRIKVEL